MAVFLITWNLNNERSNYATARREFVEHLDRFEHTKDGGLESVRWISTTMTADEVSEYLRQKLDNNDRVYITQVSRSTHAGWLNKDVWNWIAARC